MHKNLFAWTSPKALPEYVSINVRDGKVTLDARGPAQAGQFGPTIQIELDMEALQGIHDATRRDIVQEGLGRRDVTKNPNAG